MRGYRLKYLCTNCRIAMSRVVHKGDEMKCGRCGHSLTYVHHKFRAPPARDKQFWQVIEYIVSNGMTRTLDRGIIPRTMRDAKALVSAKLNEEIEMSSQTKRLDRIQKRNREHDIQRRRHLSAKKRQWARLARTGRP